MKIITRLPLETLDDPDFGNVLAIGAPITLEGIRVWLRSTKVRFVVVDVGHEPKWIDTERCYDFFKREVRPHLAETDSFRLEDFPDSYAYVARLWNSDAGPTVISLEKYH